MKLKTLFPCVLALAFASLFLSSCADKQDESNDIVVEGVSFDITNAELIPGDTLSLTATLLPLNKTADEAIRWKKSIKDLVFWKSDNRNVAQVDDHGMVIAKGVGTCNVSFVCGSLAAVCKITVRSFSQDILYGLWEMQGADADSCSFFFDGTGYMNDRFYDWTFDGMRLKLYYKGSETGQADKTMIMTTVNAGAIRLYYADDESKSSFSLIKRPMEFTPQQIAYGQIQKSALGDRKIEVVDLGLPSGIMWASCNLGAESPEQDGTWYAWAETESRQSFLLEDYKWYDATTLNLTKYADGTLISVEPSDDAVTCTYGDGWRMPSAADVNELIENCNVMYASMSGKEGLAFIPKDENYNDRRLFLPFCMSSDMVNQTGSNAGINDKFGFFWTSTVSVDSPFDAYSFSIGFDHNSVNLLFVAAKSRRECGLCIRPVYVDKK